ncbi:MULTISPECIES: isoprenylcysteine carboxylmethyltransferase family protein [Acidobacteriaceae]|uniref:methyltransferase family protein n=1 Tax=Acidobacteriaceae TaxID=204434 RepID=UPI00131BF603|nr:MULTISPECIES: isoprenylcysteine carboxylmethyltransferase family protein [Acidobacteriaceae]MDW5265620.1 isoprenylcysteine carboxylmethyltransferase family protein [Edaphobacter sp.]
MKATMFEFRFRFLIHFVIIVLGFTAPWDRWLHVDSSGPNAHVWGTLAAYLAMLKSGTVGIATAFNVLLIVGIVCALAGAALRTWGSAYLGANTVKAHTFQGNGVVASGPYRFVRNPLYLGTVIHVLALALLMPPSGAVFTIVAIVVFQIRLILGEEAFLAAKLGEPYLAYCARVPRLLPALTPRVASSQTPAAWGTALLGEIYMWGVAIAFIAVGYRYNAFLITQGVIVSLGVSLVARALIPKASVPQDGVTPID